MMSRFRRALELYGNYFVKHRTPVIVYSVERSGSVALFHSLLAHGVFAIGSHYLSQDRIKKGCATGNGSARWASKHIILKGTPAKIISLVRNPIDNMVSTFARSDFGDRAAGASVDGSGEIDPAELTRQFRTCYLDAGRYLHPLTWFENEFQVALGIDVYGYAFDKQRGHARFRQGPFDVLLLRTEMEDPRKAKLVAEFLGLPDFTMEPASARSAAGPDMAPGRAGEQATYGRFYRVLKRYVTVPEEYLDTIIGSRYAQHFFPEETLRAMKRRYLP